MTRFRYIGSCFIASLFASFVAPVTAHAQGTISLEFGLSLQCAPSIRPGIVSVPAEGATMQIGLALTAPADCDWKLTLPTNDAVFAWPLKGRGHARIDVAVAPNTSTRARSFSIRVSAGHGGPFGTPLVDTLSINQAGKPVPPRQCVFTVPATTVPVAAAGGHIAVAMSTRNDCRFIAYSIDGNTAVTPSSGVGSTTFYVDVPRNPSIAARDFTASIAGVLVTFRQAGVPCVYSVAPWEIAAPRSGGTFAVDVKATPMACPQATVQSSPYLAVVGRSDDTGSGRVTFAVAANASLVSRDGYLDIGPTRVRIRQAGAPPNGTTVDGGNRAGPLVRVGSQFRVWTGFVLNYGAASDLPLLADFDGDGILDFVVFRRQPGTSVYFMRPSSGACPALFETEGVTGDGHLVCRRPYGADNATPVRFNADGDAYDDVAVYDTSTSMLHVTTSTGMCPATIPASGVGYDGRNVCSVRFGLPGDRVVPGDYDGDGRTDLAVWRPSSGYFHILPSSGAGPSAEYQVQWGLAGDTPVPARFADPTRTSLVVYRPSEGRWYLRTTTPSCPAGFDSLGSVGAGAIGCARSFGLHSDTPVAQDYDGDGLADIGVLRQSTSEWLVVPSSGICAAPVPTQFVNNDRRVGCRTIFAAHGALPLSGAR